MKPNIFKFTAILLIIAGCFYSCERDLKKQDSQVSNITFTPCQQPQQAQARNGELSDGINVEFTNDGVHIVYHDFEVFCDFNTVNVTYTFVNGFLNITQQGFPNQADCICHTDVSYTINGISKTEVNVIFINGVQVYCHDDTIIEQDIPCNCVMDTLKGEWTWVKKCGGFAFRIWDNEFKSIVKILSQNEDASINYEVFVEDTLFYRGSFQIQEDRWNNRVANIKLPHIIYGDDQMWQIILFNILESEYNEETSEYIPTKDALTLWDGAMDGYFYIYKKITNEE